MADSGEDKLTAVARHIAKTLGHTHTMTGDILNIFSNFDGRLRQNLSVDAAQQTLASLRRKLSPHLSSDAPIWSDAADSLSFLASVDRLIDFHREWTPSPTGDNTFASCLDAAEDLLRQSTSRLIGEFQILARRGGAWGGDFSIEDVNPIPEETVDDLHEITKRLAAAGRVEECSHVYVTCRQEFLEETLFNITGLLQDFTIDEVQKLNSAQLEVEVSKWIKTAIVAVQILYPTERQLYDRVFSGLSSTTNLSFMEICNASFVRLINLAEALTKGSRPSPERLFKLLDLYETVRDLMPELDKLFSDNYKAEIMSFWQGLSDIVKGIFSELENLICRDPPKDVVPGGGLHPINRYVTNYLCAACQSRQTLDRVFQDEVDSLAVRVSQIMELLESNLEVKSKVYRDPALSSVFMMNNVRYIVRKVKGNEMGMLLGDDWVRKRTAKIRQYHVSYQRCSWGKVLGLLKFDNSNPMLPYGSPKSLRNKLKAFNSCFDEISKIQSSWVIFDEQLREELRISVSGMMSPAYRSFLGRLRGNPDVDKYIKYSVEDVEARIIILFQGSSGRR